MHAARAASLLHHDHVANAHVLDQMIGNAGDDCRCIVRRRVTDHMTNRHPAERSHADARRGAQPGADLRKNGASHMLRMTMLVNVMSSIGPPSTLSRAKPRQFSNTQLPITMFLKPPVNSVPHLIPVPSVAHHRRRRVGKCG